MTNFVELIAFKYGEVKTPITVNVNCIKAVFTEGGDFSKVIVSDEVKELLEEYITASVSHPRLCKVLRNRSC